MKPFQLIVVLFAATVLTLTEAFGANWEVENPNNFDAIPRAGLRRMQDTTDFLSTESTSSASAMDTSASAVSSTFDSEPPSTIMVLLPDNLAASFSGSGSVMFFDGSIGNGDSSKITSISSDSMNDKASSSAPARTFGAMTAVASFSIMLAVLVA
ncbi:uncharacterized protein CCR75_003732 [Bremia lactucae]|uniref:Secreted protein n=1 Tax=Bremia lactucae TaxID=4779 RepID=A0A976IGG2_BRELC|nr:hypothetical protein CCR75_003732 [Bremia lactucae]